MVGESLIAALINRWRRKPSESSVDIIKNEIVQTVQTNYTGIRDCDGTVFQNTTGRPLLCLITTGHTLNGAGHNSSIHAYVAIANPPLTLATRNVLSGAGTYVGGMMDSLKSMSFFVPIGWYYRLTRVVIGGGTDADVQRWIEVEI